MPVADLWVETAWMNQNLVHPVDKYIGLANRFFGVSDTCRCSFHS